MNNRGLERRVELMEKEVHKRMYEKAMSAINRKDGVILGKMIQFAKKIDSEAVKVISQAGKSDDYDTIVDYDNSQVVCYLSKKENKNTESTGDSDTQENGNEGSENQDQQGGDNAQAQKSSDNDKQQNNTQIQQSNKVKSLSSPNAIVNIIASAHLITAAAVDGQYKFVVQPAGKQFSSFKALSAQQAIKIISNAYAEAI